MKCLLSANSSSGHSGNDKQKLLRDNVVRSAVCFCYYVGIVGLLVPVAAQRASAALPAAIAHVPRTLPIDYQDVIFWEGRVSSEWRRRGRH